MAEKEEEFRERLKKEFEEREYEAWKKTNDPAEIEKEAKRVEPFNPSKNGASFLSYFMIFVSFQAFFWLYWVKR